MHGSTSHENREIPGSPARTEVGGAQREVKRRTPLMDEAGKSYSRVVPKKVPNKAGRQAAEGLEERRLAERNSPEATTHRTQGRTRVHEALGRVRQAAERKKGERFTALLHHIYARVASNGHPYSDLRPCAP